MKHRYVLKCNIYCWILIKKSSFSFICFIFVRFIILFRSARNSYYLEGLKRTKRKCLKQNCYLFITTYNATNLIRWYLYEILHTENMNKQIYLWVLCQTSEICQSEYSNRPEMNFKRTFRNSSACGWLNWWVFSEPRP